jgi:hypothetical protein
MEIMIQKKLNMGQNMVSMGVDVNQNIYMQLQLLSEEYTF